MNDAGLNTIMIIDDDPGVVYTLTRLVKNMNIGADHAMTLKEGMEKVGSGRFDIVLLDVMLPDGSGLDAIDDIMNLPDPPQVIIMTAFSDPDGASLAIESGAWDYIRKPASPKTFRRQILRALQFQEQKRASDTAADFDPGGIIGSSRQIQTCLSQAGKIAGSNANVLITGETGTGKELFARAIHDNSPRRSEAFIVVDCSILSGNLIESVLFGHEKGAFTGANRHRNGLVKLADNGTLFLDEVGELPESVQSSFLRVLQEKKFRPVGSDREIPSNFRVISATNKDLETMVSENRFRRDLLYRLKSFALELPPLRCRNGDVVQIAEFYMASYCRSNGLAEKQLADDFLEMLEKYDWPGNVRELANTVETCIAEAPVEKTLFAYHLPAQLRARVARAAIPGAGAKCCEAEAGCPDGGAMDKLKDVMAAAEKQYLASLYARTCGDIRQICDIAGISRAALYRKLKKHGIQ